MPVSMQHGQGSGYLQKLNGNELPKGIKTIGNGLGETLGLQKTPMSGETLLMAMLLQHQWEPTRMALVPSVATTWREMFLSGAKTTTTQTIMALQETAVHGHTQGLAVCVSCGAHPASPVIYTRAVRTAPFSLASIPAAESVFVAPKLLET